METPTQTTPARGRPQGRYPAALSKGDPGRVPLHRRGTSNKYERLEDLLREAGYKETRVFTPETERAEQAREGRSTGRMIRDSSARGVGAVVDFISGWMPGAAKDDPVDTEDENATPRAVASSRAGTNWSTPSSPLAHKRSLRKVDYTLSPSPSSTTLSSMHTSGSSTGRTISHAPRSSRHQYLYHLPDQPPQSSSSGNLRAYAHASAARGYLRHMASAPNIPRPTTSSTRESSAERPSYALDHDQPPLPPSWLDTVAKAVLGSAESGVHIGAPVRRHSMRSPRPKQPRPPRSPLQTVTPGTLAPGPAGYLRRAQTAPGAVNTAQVVCRSAPGSRSASRAGERAPAPFGSLRAARGRRPKPQRVPSLASTRVENDGWGAFWVNGRRVSLGGGGHVDTAADDGSDDDEDDDGELDLARLLVPPKRQYSIQSLRRHLHHEQARRVLDVYVDEDGEDAPVRGRRGLGAEMDTDDDGYPRFGGLAHAPKRRRLPGPWATLGNGGD